jgi:hypothetical protein
MKIKLIVAAIAGLVVGCSEGERIPPSKGGAEARNSVEYPFGPPTNLKNVKPKKSALKKSDTAVDVEKAVH